MCANPTGAGSDGPDGVCVQPGHQEHHLRGAAGLCPDDPQGAAAPGGTQEEERPHQVNAHYADLNGGFFPFQRSIKKHF